MLCYMMLYVQRERATHTGGAPHKDVAVVRVAVHVPPPKHHLVKRLAHQLCGGWGGRWGGGWCWWWQRVCVYMGRVAFSVARASGSGAAGGAGASARTCCPHADCARSASAPEAGGRGWCWWGGAGVRGWCWWWGDEVGCGVWGVGVWGGGMGRQLTCATAEGAMLSRRSPSRSVTLTPARAQRFQGWCW